MADEIQKIKHCDYPGCNRRGAKVHHWRLDNQTGFAECDLCPEHGQPIRELIDALPERLFVKLPSSSSRSRLTGFQKVTIEEIEREKRRK